MSFYTHANFAFSTLAADIATEATSLSVATGTGTKFPAAGTFVCVIWDAVYSTPDQDASREIIEVTARSTDTCTIVRARETTTAKAWSAGAKIANVFTAATAAQYETFPSSQTAAAGTIPVTQNTSGDLKLLDEAKIYFGTDAYISGTGDPSSGHINFVLGGVSAIAFSHGMEGGYDVSLTGSVGTTGQIVTTIATGTAPLGITSTTKVDNLNVDSVDGFHASQAAGANQIPVLNEDGRLLLGATDDRANKLQVVGSGYFSTNVGIGCSASNYALDISKASNAIIRGTDTTTSSATTGAGFQMQSDDGAAMSNGDRLGVISFGGAKDSSHTRINSCSVAGFAAENWGTSACGASIQFQTTANGTTTRVSRLSITESGRCLIGPTLPTDDTVNALQVGGDATVSGVYKVDNVQVVGNRVIDARCDDTINSGDATTDGVIDALRDAMITHGLIAAA